MIPTFRKSTGYFKGRHVAMAREKLGLSQEQFAELCGWSQSTQNRYEAIGIDHAIGSSGEPLMTMNRIITENGG